jgi:predicted nuclease with TOPRIM domain
LAGKKKTDTAKSEEVNDLSIEEVQDRLEEISDRLARLEDILERVGNSCTDFGQSGTLVR